MSWSVLAEIWRLFCGIFNSRIYLWRAKKWEIFWKPYVSHCRINLLVKAAGYLLILKYYQSGQWTDMSCRNLELKVDFLVAQSTSHLLYWLKSCPFLGAYVNSTLTDVAVGSKHVTRCVLCWQTTRFIREVWPYDYANYTKSAVLNTWSPKW